MNPSRLLPYIPVFGLALAACLADSAPPDLAWVGSAETLGGGGGAVPVNFDEMCPGTRMVGRVDPNHSCPETEGLWLGGDLFVGLGSGHPALAGYCLYEWQGEAPPTAVQIATLPAYGGELPEDWLDKDCMAVGPSGRAAQAYQAVQPTLHQAFLDQLGAPSTMNGGGHPVRIAIIDSRPETSPLDPRDQLGHGLGMLSIIEDLTCDRMTGPCPITLRPQLALNLEAPDEANPVKGGFYGYQSHLAQQIFESWQSWTTQAPNAHLIVHLALGWAPEYSVGSAHSTSEAVEAIASAVEVATCAGALVLAAAGNTTGAPATSGPLEPGAWETRNVNCGSAVLPLLHSVGGVDGSDDPLFNTRAGGRPTLAAPAFMVAPDHPDRLLGPFTGSSVGVAVASAAAAVLWSRDPKLTPAAIVQSMIDTGVSLLEPADYCASPPCGEIHRISLCGVAEEAYGVPLGCSTPAAGAGSNPILSQAEADNIKDLVTHSFAGTCGASYLPAGCSSPVFSFFDPASPPASALTPWLLCAEEHLPTTPAAAAIGPQGPIDPCGLCTIDAQPIDPLIHLAVSERLDGFAFPTTLVLLDDRGDPVADAIDLSNAFDNLSGAQLSDGLAAGQVAEVEVIGFPAVDYSQIKLHWLTDLANPRTFVESAVLLR